MILTTIDRLFAGGLTTLAPEGHRTGIYKREREGPVRVDVQGIEGDQHGDLRVHGGPEKAVHHYAADHYVRLAKAWPASASALVPGSLGENLSSRGLTECDVHLGDVYRLGSCLLQLSQPRSPCWKINHRFDAERMSVHVARERITGWYYRVLEPGVIVAGDQLDLQDRQTDDFSIDRFWQIQLAHRPNLDEMLALIAIPGLAPDWKRRLGERAK